VSVAAIFSPIDQIFQLITMICRDRLPRFQGANGCLSKVRQSVRNRCNSEISLSVKPSRLLIRCTLEEGKPRRSTGRRSTPRDGHRDDVTTKEQSSVYGIVENASSLYSFIRVLKSTAGLFHTNSTFPHYPAFPSIPGERPIYTSLRSFFLGVSRDLGYAVISEVMISQQGAITIFTCPICS